MIPRISYIWNLKICFPVKYNFVVFLWKPIPHLSILTMLALQMMSMLSHQKRFWSKYEAMFAHEVTNAKADKGEFVQRNPYFTEINQKDFFKAHSIWFFKPHHHTHTQCNSANQNKDKSYDYIIFLRSQSQVVFWPQESKFT